LLVYVNAKFQQAFGCSWANELTKKLNRARPGVGLEAWRCSSGGFSLSNPSYTYTETDVMWEVRAIFFHMLLGWLNIRKRATPEIAASE
jgi:hypothetical protein